MSPEDIERLFTRSDGGFFCARWGRPIAPVVFGVEDGTLGIVKGACEAVVALAGHEMTGTDPELGANHMTFFFRDWEELTGVPGLDRMIPDLQALVKRLVSEGANQYRLFRFEPQGAIKAAFVLLRMDGELANMPADTLALNEMVQTILSWSETAFAERSPLGRAGDTVILRPDIADVIRAAYDPALPPASDDPSHALRIFARLPARA